MTLTTIEFSGSYAHLPERFYSAARPERASDPRLLLFNDDLSKELGIEPGDKGDLAQVFSGNRTLPGGDYLALAYAGHQFGHFVPQLGDGRAILIGEVLGKDGKLYDLQLKGAGRTPFSRNGDGRAALGPVLREYLVSEAMHRLGVPTTRSLAAVLTGEAVYRERALPGAVLTRVAASHLRVGTFEYFAARGDREALQALLAYATQRHYPELAPDDAPAFLDAFARRSAELVARWMSLGFVHGVMNTDNSSIAGETIDYGPCAFIDRFRSASVFSFIDKGGRYAYDRQPFIAQWNCARLGDCLAVIMGAAGCQHEPSLRTVVEAFESYFASSWLALMGAKLGLRVPSESDRGLIERWLGLMEELGLDFTAGFRGLADSLGESAGGNQDDGMASFMSEWQRRLARDGEARDQVVARMNQHNPVYIPRHHLLEEAITSAERGDYDLVHRLAAVFASPYVEQDGAERLRIPPAPEQRATVTYCGT